jgi:hypothetical protein
MECSVYSQHTIEEADCAFLHIENGEFDEAEVHLKYAAQHGAKYSMMRYAMFLLSRYQENSENVSKDDLKEAFTLAAVAWCRQNLEEDDKLYLCEICPEFSLQMRNWQTLIDSFLVHDFNSVRAWFRMQTIKSSNLVAQQWSNILNECVLNYYENQKI